MVVYFLRSSQNSVIVNMFLVNILYSKNVFLLAALGSYPEAVERITHVLDSYTA